MKAVHEETSVLIKNYFENRYKYKEIINSSVRKEKWGQYLSQNTAAFLAKEFYKKKKSGRKQPV